MKFFEETWKASQQQTKFKHGKFYMNHPKSFKKCSVTYKILQNFNVFQLGRSLKRLSVGVGKENCPFFSKSSACCMRLILELWDESNFFKALQDIDFNTARDRFPNAESAPKGNVLITWKPLLTFIKLSATKNSKNGFSIWICVFSL